MPSSAFQTCALRSEEHTSELQSLTNLVCRLLLEKTNSYVLRVRGESMIEDGILDGDFVVVERNPSPRNGDIVVALLDNAYATLNFFNGGATPNLLPLPNPTVLPF